MNLKRFVLNYALINRTHASTVKQRSAQSMVWNSTVAFCACVTLHIRPPFASSTCTSLCRTNFCAKPSRSLVRSSARSSSSTLVASTLEKESSSSARSDRQWKLWIASVKTHSCSAGACFSTVILSKFKCSCTVISFSSPRPITCELVQHLDEENGLSEDVLIKNHEYNK